MTNTRSPIRIGMVAWGALPCIVEQTRTKGKHTFGKTFGGMETAMWTLARGLAKQKHNHVTCFVAASQSRNGNAPWPHQVSDVHLQVCVDRFRAIRHDVGDSIDVRQRRLKRFSPNLLWQIPLLGLTRPFRSRDPGDCQPDPNLAGQSMDAWITFGINGASSRVVATARATGTPSFVCIRSNSGVEDRLASAEEYHNECGESATSRRFALLESDHVVVQSQWQLDRLRDVFHRDGYLARNPIDRFHWRPPIDPPSPESVSEPFDILWIGRFDDFHKRPRLMLEIAKTLPHRTIKMIANPFDAELEADLRRNAPTNVEWIDRVPFAQMPATFQRAKVFVSTGNPEHEGFPNVLLQAAASHTPIVSISDHDQFLARSGAGISCNESIDAMPHAIEKLLGRAGEAATQIDWPRVDAYLDEHHQTERVAADLSRWIHASIQAADRKPPEAPSHPC
ncbi:MAG: glycosyltransferase family 4 protein [Rhodopirellula sp. JB055]|uniref:glycosyltransferase family 4 protein n=1 Tax=Rhodopirellula sp. JB055 TaxID=3342846 RepID=UPI00370B27B9